MGANITDLGEITYSKIIPKREPTSVPLPRWIAANVHARLAENNREFLYLHQKQAIESITNGYHTVISTGTASGKSLCYQIPLMDMLMNDPTATALLMFPTKALTQDQYKSFGKLIHEYQERIFIFDGDTPKSARAQIRDKARVIYTNPDMLHMGILPYHNGWVNFFRNLKYIILDEVHVYKGVFGAHVANVIRRLKRVAAHYGATPQFILCSATLSNAKELSEKIISDSVNAIEEDYSGSGERKIVFLNPPIINEEFQLRAGSIITAAKSAKQLLEENRQLLVFCQSRQSVESTVLKLRGYDVDADGYRSGYLAAERREIESGLKNGSKRCVAATNALELGMDIGGIDAVISVGYPGSVSSLLQRQGRAGRGETRSTFVFTASQTPTDQYLSAHPEFIYGRKCEPVLTDPDNLTIMFQHLQCSLYEIPFSRGESFGNLSMEETQDIMDYFVSEGIAEFSGNKYFWLQSNTPQGTVSIRNAGLNRIAIMRKDTIKPQLIGEADRSSAYWMVHEGAIYFHNGTSYRITELDLESNIASAMRAETDYTTEAQRQCDITVREIVSTRNFSGAAIHCADVTVCTQVVSYKKIANESHQVLEILPLNLPAESLDTQAFVIVLNETLLDKLKSLSLWNSDPNDYGKNWPQIRASILKRDHYTCKLCKQPFAPELLHVHHIVPFRTFIDKRKANQPDNLTTLCESCHHRVEEAVRIRSGLSGFASAFQQIAALFLECDSEDLCLATEQTDKNFDGKPSIYLHETVPGGLGLSRSIIEHFEKILAGVCELITACSCKDGCPGCVGAGGENGVGGKVEALAICSEIGEEKSR